MDGCANCSIDVYGFHVVCAIAVQHAGVWRSYMSNLIITMDEYTDSWRNCEEKVVGCESVVETRR